MTDVTRINRVSSYKVIKEAKAQDIAIMLDLDPTHQAHFFVVSSRINHDEPRLLREYREYLKWDLRETPIFLLQLQSVESKIIRKKKEKETPPILSFLDDE